MKNSNLELIDFLQKELAISSSEIAVVLQRRQHEGDPLPMLLFSYGIISLEQLARIFDWLESRVKPIHLPSLNIG